MFIIEKSKNRLMGNIIWDVEKNCELCRFEKGIIKTDSKEIADKMENMGCTVTESTEVKED